MTTTDYLTARPSDLAIIAKRALIGAGIAYVLITVFLLVPGITPNPAWPKFWMIRPLLVVPFAGAMGGIFYHLTGFWRRQGGWKAVIALIVSLLVYVIGLWLGTVLGLVGTLWH